MAKADRREAERRVIQTTCMHTTKGADLGQVVDCAVTMLAGCGTEQLLLSWRLLPRQSSYARAGLLVTEVASCRQRVA